MYQKWLLASRSTVFKAELFGPMKESSTADAIRVDDMEAHVFRAMLNSSIFNKFIKI
jgi:speckle-type POZ protein